MQSHICLSMLSLLSFFIGKMSVGGGGLSKQRDEIQKR